MKILVYKKYFPISGKKKKYKFAKKKNKVSEKLVAKSLQWICPERRWDRIREEQRVEGRGHKDWGNEDDSNELGVVKQQSASHGTL